MLESNRHSLQHNSKQSASTYWKNTWNT